MFTKDSQIAKHLVGFFTLFMDNYRLKPNQDFMMIFLCLFCIFNESKYNAGMFSWENVEFLQIFLFCIKEDFTFCVNHNLFSFVALQVSYRFSQLNIEACRRN